LEFDKKVVVVTGSAKGIGKSIAEEFFKEGATVIVSSRHLDECKSVCSKLKGKGKAIPIKCDISKKQDVKKLFNKVKKDYKKLDILVNNAGIYPFVPFNKLDDKQWEKTININLNGTFYCTKEASKIMKKGSIINISSIAGIRGIESVVHYCSTKGALNSFTQALSLELAPNIRVNAVLPGLIITPGTKSLGKKTLDYFINSIPMKRAGQPIDIANLTLFLASEKSSFITGQLFVSDGGQTVKS
jgi:3-oxoacyl-[acyl-carrier protein] reductase